MQSSEIDEETNPPEQGEPDADYSRKWFVMAALGMATLLETIDVSVVNLALPTLVRVFNVDLTVIQWVILVFVLTQATLMLLVGRLGDLVGKKRVLLWGVIIAAIGSLLCGLAPSIGWLIGFRAIQAAGTAMALALVLATATEAFPQAERGKALGIIAGLVSVGIIVGPLLGGVLIDLLSWRWVFWVNVPIALIALPVIWRYLPDGEPAEQIKFDLFGAVAFFVSLLALLLATTYGQNTGYGQPIILTLFAVSAIFLALFIWIELRTAQPVVDMSLFGNELYSGNLILRFISFIIYVGISLLLPFYLQDIQGYDARTAGLLLTVVPIGFGIMGPVGGMLADRFGYNILMIVGLFLMLGGAILMAGLTVESSPLDFALRVALIGIGMGTFQPANNSLIFNTVPAEHRGMTSGLISVVRTIGRSAGIAIITAIWMAGVLNSAESGAIQSISDASPTLQMAGMRGAFWAVAVMVLIGILMSFWIAARDRKLSTVNNLVGNP